MCSVRKQYHCAGLPSGEMRCEHIDLELEAGVVEAAQSKWSERIGLVPK